MRSRFRRGEKDQAQDDAARGDINAGFPKGDGWCNRGRKEDIRRVSEVEKRERDGRGAVESGEALWRRGDRVMAPMGCAIEVASS